MCYLSSVTRSTHWVAVATVGCAAAAAVVAAKSCRCAMLRVTSLLIRLTILETYNYFPLNIHIELSPPPPSPHQTYKLNKAISLGLQTLNPQQNYFFLKTQTSDYHYPETSKSHTNLCRNSVTSTKHDKNKGSRKAVTRMC